MKDAEQMALDLEDAQHRLAKLRKAVVAAQEAEDLVRSLQLKLTSAKRKAKEARWNVDAMLGREAKKS